MHYSKSALSYLQQAEQLISRGLEAELSDLVATLNKINYYRLSGYWYPFRDYPNENFRPNTSLSIILERYEFDQKLRIVILAGIEPIEIFLRTHLTYYLSHQNGAFGYLEATTLPELNEVDFNRLMTDLRSNYGKSKETFALHFQGKYGEDHDLLPIWMVTELMTFGNLLTMVRGIKKQYRQALGKEFQITDSVVLSWLRALNGTRNVCAHHGRLWNRVSGYKPMIPNKDARWKTPAYFADNKIFAILTIIQWMHTVIGIPLEFKTNLVILINKYPEIPIQEMGFPRNWEEIYFWKDAKS